METPKRRVRRGSSFKIIKAPLLVEPEITNEIDPKMVLRKKYLTYTSGICFPQYVLKKSLDSVKGLLNEQHK
jgi:hypothetical protein